MATWDDVRRTALALPGASEQPSYGGAPAWKVGKASFAWERPLRRKDLEELGDAAPHGPVLGVAVADVGVKEELVAGGDEVYFTTSHFDGYAAVLVRLDRIGVDELARLLREAWAVRAPQRLQRCHESG